MTIPASSIANVNPGVLAAGGSALALNGIILTTNTRVPIGAVQQFSRLSDVEVFFGVNSTEAALAANYFAGYDNSSIKPGRLYFVQYVWETPVAAYLRGTSLAGMTLAQLQALTGSLTVTIDGTAHTAATVDLSAATSFSDAAAKLTTDLGLTGGAAVTYDSLSSAFVVTSGTTGATSTITQATGTIAASLGLSAGTLSQGAALFTPAAAMNSITSVTQNWAAFTTVFEPVLADKEAFANWVNAQNNRYAYVAWDTDANATVANNQACFGAWLISNKTSGVIPIYQSVNHAAAFLGMIASIDFSQQDGRITFAFKSQTGLNPSVTDQTTADILKANGYNFYGSYATANAGFNFFYPGLISGPFDWADEYVNQIYLNSQFQVALMTLATNVPSIPYNAEGYALIKQACMDVINEALNFGSIRPGVVLSAAQAQEVNNAAGLKIDTTLANLGWYLQVQDPGAQARSQRTTPACNFWYMDGGAVQQISLASIDVQ